MWRSLVAGRQALCWRSSGEFCILILRQQAQRERDRDRESEIETRPVLHFWYLKTHSPSPTSLLRHSSNKAIGTPIRPHLLDLSNSSTLWWQSFQIHDPTGLSLFKPPQKPQPFPKTNITCSTWILFLLPLSQKGDFTWAWLSGSEHCWESS